MRALSCAPKVGTTTSSRPTTTITAIIITTITASRRGTRLLWSQATKGAHK